MSGLLIKERDIVIPGEVLAQGMDYLPGDNTYRENDQVRSRSLGLVSLSGRVVKITPLAGPYVPKAGDKIIAKVIDIAMSGWRVETNTAYSAMMNVKDASNRFIKREEDLSKIIAIGDFLVVEITKVTSQNLIDVSMKEPGLRRIEGGRIISVGPTKVPRIIGKKASMIMLIKDKTGCEITVGQNGRVWIKGTPEGEFKAEQAIKLIQNDAHLAGLTDKVEKFLGGSA
jgi:exosome complex component RRP4